MAAGLVLGAVAGLLFSALQTPEYEAASRLMFVQQQDSGNTSVAYISDNSLAQTLAELILARPVIEEAEARLGYDVSSRRLFASQVGDTDVLELVSSHDDPVRAAEIANVVTEVFIEQQSDTNASLFASSEENLKRQVDQVKEQMDALQRDAIDEARTLKDAQLTELKTTLDELRAEMVALQQEVVQIEFSGAPVPGYDENGRWGYVIPTPSVDQRIIIEQKNARLEELRHLTSLYESLYVDMTYRSSSARVADAVPDDVQITLAQYQEIYKNLLQNYESIRLARIQSTPDLVQVEDAQVPEWPVYPNPGLFGGLGALFGLLGGFGVAFVLVSTDEVFRTPEEARILMQLPVLAYIRDLHPVEKPAAQKPHHKMALMLQNNRKQLPLSGDGLRFLRSNLDVLQDEKSIHTLLLTAPDDRSSSALLSARLAQTVAQAGRNVVLLEADLRQPKVAEVLGINAEPGLSDVLRGNAILEQVIQTSEDGCLSVITGGSVIASPADLIDRDKIATIFEALEQMAELVIVHSPPFAFAESSVLASRVDGVILAIELDHTRSTAALATMEQLHLSKAKVIGMVIL